MNASIKRMIKTMCLAVLAVHLSACFYFLIVIYIFYFIGKTWCIRHRGLLDKCFGTWR